MIGFLFADIQCRPRGCCDQLPECKKQQPETGRGLRPGITTSLKAAAWKASAGTTASRWNSNLYSHFTGAHTSEAPEAVP
ncbi:MAG: hypothetical protein EOS71_16205 [Mesorhizobium sp.]|nr:hypothetical protein EOA35_13060 [Mesorhizobium sp. M8A.F.Ca.ET.023.01.1.1]RWC74009.1 MAG: hypothetical protein EOS71_16205 [Mesorhizobium sp.]